MRAEHSSGSAGEVFTATARNAVERPGSRSICAATRPSTAAAASRRSGPHAAPRTHRDHASSSSPRRTGGAGRRRRRHEDSWVPVSTARMRPGLPGRRPAIDGRAQGGQRGADRARGVRARLPPRRDLDRPVAPAVPTAEAETGGRSRRSRRSIEERPWGAVATSRSARRPVGPGGTKLSRRKGSRARLKAARRRAKASRARGRGQRDKRTGRVLVRS